MAGRSWNRVSFQARLLFFDGKVDNRDDWRVKMVTLLAWTVKRGSMPGKEDLDYWGCEQDHSDVSLMNDYFCDFLCLKFQDEVRETDDDGEKGVYGVVCRKNFNHDVRRLQAIGSRHFRTPSSSRTGSTCKPTR